MKRTMIVLVLCLFSVMLAGTDIASTGAGGNWTSESTWQGGVVPGVNDNVWIIGPVTVNSYPTIRNMHVEPSGSLTNPANFTGSVYVTEDLVNTGNIQDASWTDFYLAFSCYGSVYNYGSFTASHIQFLGTDAEELGNTGTFLPDRISCQTGYGGLTLLNDLALINTVIELGAPLVLTGRTVSLSGGCLRYATVTGGASTVLNFSDGAYIRDVTADELTLTGVVSCLGINIDILHNYSTLQNLQNNSDTVIVNQLLDNHGLIRNNPLSTSVFDIELHGDIYDHGEITCRRIIFYDDVIHNIWQAESAPPINCQLFSMTSTSGDLQLLSDLSFLNSQIDCANNSMFLWQGRSCYDLSLQGGCLKYAVLATSGFSTLAMSDGAWFVKVLGGDLIFQGTVLIEYDPFSHVFHSIVNYGTIQNNTIGTQLNITGNLVNHGNIRNNPTGGYLTLYCGGDIANYGSITNSYSYVDGVANQYVLTAPGSALSCPGAFILKSMIGAAQWFFGTQLVASGIQDINLNSYPAYWLVPGVWQPVAGGTYGRLITFGTGETLSIPQNPSILVSGPELVLQWDAVAGAAWYQIYAASDPYGTYTPLEKAYDHDPSDGIVWWELTPAEPFQFYKVSAGN